MLIDHFAPNCIDELCNRVSDIDSQRALYLLIDGAFVSGAHRVFREEEKRILFDTLPGCSDDTRDVSPFLLVFDAADRRQRVLLHRCSGWPMVCVIETAESLVKLSRRLADWCVVEADGQRFNFRFSDTRRLPAIFKTLSPQQRASFVGPMKRWSYVCRDGRWGELPVGSDAGEAAADPSLDERQFAFLVDDSRADELLVLLRDRGRDVYGSPSRSHALMTMALRAALMAELDDDEALQWCEWFWKHGKLGDDTVAASLLESWRKETV